MGKTVEFKWSNAGYNELKRTAARAAVEAATQEVLARANAAKGVPAARYKASVMAVPYHAVGMVTFDNEAAVVDNARNNTLEKARG